MRLSRRNLLGASAALAAGAALPPFSLAAGAAGANATQSIRPSAARPVVLAWNENPYGPGPAARQALNGAVGGVCRYPDEEHAQLVAALASHEHLDPQEVVTGTGSGELLCALGGLVARDRGEIIAAEPTYLELTEYARRAGASLRFVPVDAQLRHDLEAMHAALTPDTRAVYLCNPNNPTGTALPAARIRDFVAALPTGVIAIIDEAYMDFADEPGVESVADLVAGGHPVVVLRTFSKIHGLAGVRCGYGLTTPELATRIAGARMSTANLLAMRAARASLGDREFLAATRARILASRARMRTAFEGLGCRYAAPQGNFVFFDTGMPLERFAALMRERHILVGRLFPPYRNWCRITIGTEPEVSAFLDALPPVLAAGRNASPAAA